MHGPTTIVRPSFTRTRRERLAKPATPIDSIVILMGSMPATLLLSLARREATAAVPEQVRVFYADLNLGRAAARIALRQRIGRAARDLGAADDFMFEFKRMRLNERCIAEAIASVALQTDPGSARTLAEAA